MNLSNAIESYMTLKRSLGAVFSAEARILHFFARTLGNVAVDTISSKACHQFCRGTGPPTQWWPRKHQTLRGFFTYLVSRGHLITSPLLEPAPKVPRSFEPYVYSRDEVQRLLNATAILEDSRSPLQHLTFRTLLLLLLRRGTSAGGGIASAVLRRGSRRPRPRNLGHQVLQVPAGTHRLRPRHGSRHLPQGSPFPADADRTPFGFLRLTHRQRDLAR